MSATFRCQIVTPAEPVLDQQASYVSFPAWDGQKGVMNSTSPFLVRLGIGPMRVDFPQAGSRWYLLEGGFAQMQRDTLTILADRAIPAERLAVSDAEQEFAAVSGKDAIGTDRATLDRKLQVAREKVALAKAASTRGI